MLDGKYVEKFKLHEGVIDDYVVYRKVYRKEQRGVMSLVCPLDPLITNLDKKCHV
ncbi:hypothetical protein Hanom_Chr12g01156321 [Helianthus anomalus]